MELVSLILLIALFLCIGSFSSVVIYRLISMEFSNTNINLFSPRSHCPNCKKNISFGYINSHLSNIELNGLELFIEIEKKKISS